MRTFMLTLAAAMLAIVVMILSVAVQYSFSIGAPFNLDAIWCYLVAWYRSL